jgi:hypothetical protein
MKSFATQLDALQHAETVAFGPVGFAARTLPVTEAYYELAEHLTPALRPGLDRLLRKASPAGKVYAAVLLSKLDPRAGRQAWHRLAGDRSAVGTFSGCIMGETTLADYAAAQLSSA